MGCKHYEAAADKAEAQIKTLEAERAQYVAAQTSITTAQSAIACYTNFLSSLASAMSNVIVSGEPFDKNESQAHCNKLESDSKKLDALLNEMQQALKEIADEILSLEPIVDARNNVCDACDVLYRKQNS